jgi:hypothetical protein
MKREEAQEMATEISKHGTFSSVRVEQEGGEFAMPDSPWHVELWNKNPQSGNFNLTDVTEYEPKNAAHIANLALRKAVKRDRAAYRRIEAEKQMDNE